MCVGKLLIEWNKKL